MSIKNYICRYPTQKDTKTGETPSFSPLVDGEDVALASQWNAFADAIIALEAEVGSDNLESGSLRKRVDSIEQNQSGWITALDLDFSTQESQTISSDGNYTIGGVIFNKFNSANDNVAMVLTNGQGVIIRPKQATDYYLTTRTGPGLRIQLSSIIPDFDVSVPIRVWVYISAGNFSANYDHLNLIVENQTTNCVNRLFKVYNSNLKLGMHGWVGGGSVGAAYESTTHSAKNVLILDLPTGVLVETIRGRAGTYAAGFPAFKDVNPISYKNPYSSAFSSQENLGIASDWYTMLCAGRAGSATALSVTVARLKIEYRK